ncbi:TIGR01244 family phosphatase [Polymorphobacter sp. PAMC 29334]|uniref:TIGR01244 family sulfur transferase n=1 Tax=Polymorphobacter sp. PAMC 29334 TaxID=2862331 RepID=UPI001C7513CF|nr:TIGR01244 family sulfur transferase [Polymorphobacter sp. PAMC 29334]QYE36230.1 TIGR01244 family phosphatase [Polymorphobacter sp. PAMC 29334]
MFIRLTEAVSVAGQIAPDDLAAAAAAGFTHVVNNRPDGEEYGQPASAEMHAAATAAGLGYTAIPVDHRGFDMGQVAAMAAALDASAGPVLAFCRSGTRSANLWALAEAKRGGNPDAIIAAAASGRYDVSGLRATLVSLSGA